MILLRRRIVEHEQDAVKVIVPSLLVNESLFAVVVVVVVEGDFKKLQ